MLTYMRDKTAMPVFVTDRSRQSGCRKRLPNKMRNIRVL